MFDVQNDVMKLKPSIYLWTREN